MKKEKRKKLELHRDTIRPLTREVEDRDLHPVHGAVDDLLERMKQTMQTKCTCY